MSVEASAWAWKQIIPANPKFVLIALADWYNELESCAWPSHQKLCEKTGMSRSSVKRALGWLRDNQLVVVEHQYKHNKQLSNRYRLPIGIIYIQGVQCEPHGVQCEPQGGLCDLPIEDTIKDTVKDTIKLASNSTQEKSLKISDVIETNTKTKKSIFEKFKSTPKGCADFWRDARGVASNENGFSAELLVKDYKQLDNARKRIPQADFREVVWKVMSDWIAFSKYAEKHFGAFNMGLNPTVSKFVLQIEAAADYATPVKLTAQPLTKQPAPCTPIPKVNHEAAVVQPYVNPYHPKPKKTDAEKKAIMDKLNKVDI